MKKRYSLEDRVIVMTGATGGLGRAATAALLARNARLALLDIDQETVQRMARDLGAPDRVAGWAADVRSMEGLTTVMAQVAEHFGGIEVAIAGAGINITGSMEMLDPDDFDRVIDINLNGVWRTFKSALPYVKKRKGYLLAISSMAAFVHSPLYAQYPASKAGVWAMCDSIRLELESAGVDVGSLHPTFFQTPMMEAEDAGFLSKHVWNDHQGMWKFVPIEEVIDGLIACIEQRRDVMTVPRRHQIIALAPGLARRFAESFGFDRRQTQTALRLERERKLTKIG